MTNKPNNVAIYCRLSKDDGTQGESGSISTQKEILTQYVKLQGWHLSKIYVDDGFSGTNFNRPDFQRMIKDIESGLIDCVITKDLSRLGRNYLDCGLYLEVFFPEHNVRYIAVNDGVDTLNKSAMDITPFRNILNEMYSSDISSKIKSAYKARFHQGKFMGVTAPYGYLKDPKDHNHLIIDEKTAPIVRKIFELAKNGDGVSKIRKHLNSHRILRPAAMAIENGGSFEHFFEGNEENKYIWSENSVRSILRSPVYAGHLVGYKRPAVSMKSKKKLSRKPEDWEVVKNTHEAIVSQVDFDIIQSLMTSRRKENSGEFDNIFAGLLKCADCGYAMRSSSAHRRKRPEIIDCIQYSCNNYGRYGNTTCSSHTIEARALFEAVLSNINHFVEISQNDEKMVRELQKRINTVSDTQAKANAREQRKLQKRLSEIDNLFSALYEDKVMDKITERNYELMSRKFEKEQADIEQRLSSIEDELMQKQEKDNGIIDFVNTIKNFNGIKELTAPMLHTLIDKIVISEKIKNSHGEYEQKIIIYYKFVGALNELHIEIPKRYCVSHDKVCVNCGSIFKPNNNVAKYCSNCKREMHRQQTNEIKLKSRVKTAE